PILLGRNSRLAFLKHFLDDSAWQSIRKIPSLVQKPFYFSEVYDKYRFDHDLLFWRCDYRPIIACHGLFLFLQNFYTLPGQQDIRASGNTLYLNEETL
ncbi:MAG: hypothetical protein WBW79_17705, partial [Desulfocapsaceae bacterium]